MVNVKKERRTFCKGKSCRKHQMMKVSFDGVSFHRMLVNQRLTLSFLSTRAGDPGSLCSGCSFVSDVPW